MNGFIKYQVRFFFDYGAGGCLWANDDRTRQAFGLGPIDYCIAEKTGQITSELLLKIDAMDLLHGSYLNKNYQPDPSCWTQQECDSFNESADKLLAALKMQLRDFEIVDNQERYAEDPDLNKYLEDPQNFKRDR